jgi:uncharacterized protein (DUF1778 family)
MKGDLIQIRIDTPEKERLREAAKAAGMTLSEWMLMVARREVRKPPSVLKRASLPAKPIRITRTESR